MLPERRAVIFDLDDTLYPYRRFVWSGFREVARHVQWTHGLKAPVVFRRLALATFGADRGRELQTVLGPMGVPECDVSRLVALVRQHEPTIRLPQASRRLLATLRGGGWRLAVLTNGDPDIQGRKIRALGLSRYVDAVVYAAAHGSGAGKPDPEAFDAAAREVGAEARHIVMVGDDEACDVRGAIAAGMLAVRCAVWRRDGTPCAGQAIARRFTQIPGLARVLLEEANSRHAA